jgi:3-deoxy-7-phosphoheptulonate synthase
MIVVMKTNSAPEEIDGVIRRVSELGLAGHLVQGEQRTVIGVVGQVFPELGSMLETLPGVDEIVRISKPYKLSGRELHPHDSIVQVGDLSIGDGTTVIMAGPCSVESEEQLVSTARVVKEAGANVLRGGAFKPRTSPYAFRGLGEDGLKLLDTARAETGLPVITEVLTPQDVDIVARYSDILQIGARNMQNFILLEECGRSGKPCLLKRGFSNTVEEWLLSSEYILATGNRQVMLCERGIRTFETLTRNTLDVSAIPLVKRLSHLPVIGDPSHGTGKWYLVEPMAMAATAAGADGLLIEVHPNPDHALSDGPQSLTFDNFAQLMRRVEAVADVCGRPLAGRRATVQV